MSCTPVLRLLPYDYERYAQVWGTVSNSDLWLTLIDGQSAGVNDIRVDTKEEKRLTSYKYVRTGKNTETGKGGDKTRIKRIRPKDRKKENLDIQISGWLQGDNAKRTAGLINYYANKANLAMLLVTNQVDFIDSMGGPRLDSTHEWSFDTAADFTAGPTGSLDTTDVSTRTDDFVEGNGSVRYYEISPTSGGLHILRYNPSSTMSMLGNYFHFWFKCDHDHDSMDKFTFQIMDTDGDSVYIDFAGDAVSNPLQPFKSNTWTRIVIYKQDMTEMGTFNATSVDYVDWEIDLKAGDSGAFTHYDGSTTLKNQGAKRDFPFFTIEQAQVTKRAGVQNDRYEYTIVLKRILDPPYG